MYLTDEQLMLLEQLTYLDSAVTTAAEVESLDISEYKDKSVEDFLKSFSETALVKLESKGTLLTSDGASTYAQGNEWAAVIRAIKDDEDLMSLSISDKSVNSDGTTVAICFTDSGSSDEAIVAFRGTVDGDEWKDNVEGLNLSDTANQIEALNYIESLAYRNITVVGHSKGGNKAQYVAITSDKVNRCVSMDGQGFSQEFMDKYWAEIQSNAGSIKNYSLDNDYVHILLFPIPGASQIYCVGDGMESGAENHSPTSFFKYGVDEDGHAVLTYKDGSVLHITNTENPAMIYLHGFVCFVMNVMPDEDKNKVVEYLGNILCITMGGGSVSINGTDYSKDNIAEYIFTDPEMAALIVAYVLKYVDTYGLSSAQVYTILDAFGMGFLVSALGSSFYNSSKAEDFLKYIIKQLSDGKDDPIIEALLGDLADFWRMIEKKYSAIGNVDARFAIQNATVKTGKVMDFSKSTYELLLSVISSIETNLFGDVSSWGKYSGEDWFSSLGISIAMKGINAYIDNLTNISNKCKQQIETIFSNEWQIDASAGEKITELFEGLEKSVAGLEEMAEQMGQVIQI